MQFSSFILAALGGQSSDAVVGAATAISTGGLAWTCLQVAEFDHHRPWRKQFGRRCDQGRRGPGGGNVASAVGELSSSRLRSFPTRRLGSVLGLLRGAVAALRQEELCAASLTVFLTAADLNLRAVKAQHSEAPLASPNGARPRPRPSASHQAKARKQRPKMPAQAFGATGACSRGSCPVARLATQRRPPSRRASCVACAFADAGEWACTKAS